MLYFSKKNINTLARQKFNYIGEKVRFEWQNVNNVCKKNRRLYT